MDAAVTLRSGTEVRVRNALPPFQYERVGILDLVVDANGVNRVFFPALPGAIAFGNAAEAWEAAGLLNALP